ncbi:MAG TPA: FUSC family protein [Jatrophihabitantaceae bacterium]
MTFRDWLPVWSKPAFLRAVRATIVVPGLFAIAYEVVGNLQMATFAAFGGFATLVLASFGGTRRDKLIAHLGLAVAGSLLLIIGTAVNANTALAACTTLVVGFVVLFAGVSGPNGASGGAAAMLAYVLPAASPGTNAMIPDRLAGWWLASAAGTIAVLVLSPRPPGDQLRAAAARVADALAAQLSGALDGDVRPELRKEAVDAKRALMSTFTATPYRPTGLATTDRALESLVGLLEWCGSVINDSLSEYMDLCTTLRAPVERELLVTTADVLRDVGAMLRGEHGRPDVDRLNARLIESVTHLHELNPSDVDYSEAVHLSFHARTVAVTTVQTANDALIATRMADSDTIAAQRLRWAGGRPVGGSLTEVRRLVAGHAGLRSVWFLNSVRGAIALAAAVAVADLTDVQHGFWVVLGTLSVLRTNAASTGSTALRALLGTVLGFAVGGLLIVAIGTSHAALWTALPVAVFVAAYAPGTAPFAIGQAAFTVVVSVLFNLLVPEGWKIGVVRIEDVAIGCAVSLVAGALFWPRGAGAVVGDDLADAFRLGAAYLTQAVRWALGLGHELPRSAPAVTAGIRLDDALRGYLAEQGSKRMPKNDLWRLVIGATRLRLTAHSLAGLPNPSPNGDPVRGELGERADIVAAWFDRLAAYIDPHTNGTRAPLEVPVLNRLATESPNSYHYCTLWVDEHLQHITPHMAELITPAEEVAVQRRKPWWR